MRWRRMNMRVNQIGYDYSYESATADEKVSYFLYSKECNTQWGKATLISVNKLDWRKHERLFYDYFGEIISTYEKISIKNSFLGVDYIALERFPKMSELFDEANAYHLFLFKKSEFCGPMIMKDWNGAQYTEEGTIFHEYLPTRLNWSEKQNYKNCVYGAEAIGFDILDMPSTLSHFVIVPEKLVKLPELIL